MIGVITEEAEADLEQIGDAIAVDSPERSLSFVRELRGCCEGLAQFPKAYPLVPRYEGSAVRRRVHGNYLIFYRIGTESIDVLHVLHGAVDYEPICSLRPKPKSGFLRLVIKFYAGTGQLPLPPEQLLSVLHCGPTNRESFLIWTHNPDYFARAKSKPIIRGLHRWKRGNERLTGLQAHDSTASFSQEYGEISWPRLKNPPGNAPRPV